ncbi:hypothetical protein BGW36DRAFT_382438 [Talaromyces proteolyticus]|uniref:Archaemetzincin-2 n=1 Tax=Talaromyces proteolyticus TaxID=1131652 RepID=A0AAD4KLC4_9EURO|nr:uncharacterized protein BGW36DRAFT_382438 [Talaromyces proteolyticus]KAH8695284.1 hypothetical protein BGW36DRAFT_382438 [Talaromyces proteolyticus]
MKPCAHSRLQFESSPWAAEVGFKRVSPDRRLGAATRSGRNPLAGKGQQPKEVEIQVCKVTEELSAAFPGPLVLPHDDLTWDPKSPPQSFRSWLNLPQRNRPTSKRKTIYVATAPEISSGVDFMHSWISPQIRATKRSSKNKGQVTSELKAPESSELIDYIASFYHGFVVKTFPTPLRFIAWDETEYGKHTSTPEFVGLAADDMSVRIRARPSPDGVFKGQLNLDDLLDAARDILPSDAYSIVLIMNHDMYESQEDDFCCGRAYGGSRISVISMARYHPILDDYWSIDPAHVWPASHCEEYVNNLCGESKKSTLREKGAMSPTAPFRRAVDAAARIKNNSSVEYYRGIWFSRVARTAVHELGHCFGIAHCVYYACSMQGTAGIAEDLRQPPYLCPICLSKITHAAVIELLGRTDSKKEDYVRERYEALAQVCDTRKHIGLFAGYGAWLRARIENLNESQTV